MGEDKRDGRRHSILMEERERVRVSGVEEVLSFDEETVVCGTELGILTLSGSGLHISRLDVEAGDLLVDGQIDAATYSEEGPHPDGRSLWGRLFR